jgi:hypothetical protein
VLAAAADKGGPSPPSSRGSVTDWRLCCVRPPHPTPAAAAALDHTGPDVGGGAEPYRQSERASIYKQYVDRLVAEGRAYPCFCTDEELEAMKAEAEAKKLPPIYR